MNMSREIEYYVWGQTLTIDYSYHESTPVRSSGPTGQAPVRSSGPTGPRERDLRFASTGERTPVEPPEGVPPL